VLRNARLGWHDPIANAFTGPDADTLRRTFQSLQTWLDFPIVGLTGSVSAFAAGNATVAWGTELYDDYNLHDTSATTIRAPQQAQRFFVVGAVTGKWAGTGAGRRIFTWLKSGVATNFNNSNSTAVTANPLTAVFMGTLLRTETLGVQVTHDAATNQSVADMELWLIFLPMGG